jgi:hypothetical protein
MVFCLVWQQSQDELLLIDAEQEDEQNYPSNLFYIKIHNGAAA